MNQENQTIDPETNEPIMTDNAAEADYVPEYIDTDEMFPKGPEIDELPLQHSLNVTSEQYRKIDECMDDMLLDGKSDNEIANEVLRMSSPDYLETHPIQWYIDKGADKTQPLIDGLLYPGLYFFSGAPKVGKSCCMLQLSYCLATGQKFLGFATNKCDVTYLSLEDSPTLMISRLEKVLEQGIPDNLQIGDNAKKLYQGFEDQIRAHIKAFPKTRLVIIDILQRLLESTDRYSYSTDYEIAYRLKQLADECNICLIAVHHTRKMQTNDKMELMSGTNGLLGACDGAFVMYKDNRVGNSVVIDATGRQIADQRIELKRNDTDSFFERSDIETTARITRIDDAIGAIVKLVNPENPTFVGTASELTDALGLNISPATLGIKLHTNAALLYNKYNIDYTIKRLKAGRIIFLKYIEHSNP